jgi:glycosyltransferase involved in cell wall biosynthesis
MDPTVSVIIPAYNAAGHVTRAVKSVLGQTHAALEVLVVDDGSKDRTAEVVAAMPPPVRLIRKENGGPASARNLGAREAKGRWLALLDADDWWFPDKLRLQLITAAEPGVGMVHCLPDHRRRPVPPVIDFDTLWARNVIINSSVLMHRDAFAELGGFNEARELISVEDYNLWLRFAASRWIIATCPHVLVHYTRGIGISSNSERFMRASLFNVDDLASKLRLPEEMVARKKTEIVFSFGSLALFQRDLRTARRLLWQAVRRQPSARHGLHLAVSLLPESLLDLRRRAAAFLVGPNSPAPEQVEAADLPAADRPWTAAAIRAPAMISGAPRPPLDEASFTRPVLVTTIDAEEDFDWTRPFSRAATDVRSMRSQHRAHRIFERYGVVPTYMVDYPVAAQDTGRAPLRELLQGGLCEIGAQLHPWVTPPFIESLSEHSSYAGNLAPGLEYSKVQALTSEIEAAFGAPPRIFRAGRYGVGPNTAGILTHFGYEADSSVVPRWSFAARGGPDFRRMTAHPFWIDPERHLLELPVSAAVVGRAADLLRGTTARLFSPRSEATRLPAVLARLGMLERIKLTPEGITIEEAKRLVRHMRSLGHRIFVLTYHSPSLEPGNTPYVRTEGDLDAFLRWLDEFYAFFATEIGGINVSWRDVRDRLRALPP